jgi:hypothetical protein
MDMSSISFIVPTIGRDTLGRTLRSINTWPGDEIIVVKHNPPSGNWGNAERQEGMEKAKCDWLAFIDDDDVYCLGHREIMDMAIKESNGFPILFKMQYPSGRILWDEKKVKNGNIGAPMILVPNIPDMITPWDQIHSWADFQFVNHLYWHAKDYVWRDEVICQLGHNDEKYERHLNFNQARKEGILV